MRLNKKATIPEALFDIALTILVVFIAIFIMFSFGKINENQREDKSADAMNSAIAHNMIALYLKTPVKVNNEELKMEDLLVLAFENKGEYEEKLRQATKEFFKSTLGFESDKDYYFCMAINGLENCIIDFGRLKHEMHISDFASSGTLGGTGVSGSRYSQFYLPSLSEGSFSTIIITKN